MKLSMYVGRASAVMGIGGLAVLMSLAGLSASGVL